MARRGRDRRGNAGKAGYGGVGRGLARHGRYGAAGKAWRGNAGLCAARQAWMGTAGMACVVRHGLAMRGKAGDANDDGERPVAARKDGQHLNNAERHEKESEE